MAKTPKPTNLQRNNTFGLGPVQDSNSGFFGSPNFELGEKPN